MRTILLEILLLSLSFLLLKAYDIPTLDLRNGITDNKVPVLKVNGPHHLFRIMITINPSTGYTVFDVPNPKSNCIRLVELRGKSYIKPKGPHLMGQSETEVMTYEAKFKGKQQLLLVYRRTKPNPNTYD